MLVTLVSTCTCMLCMIGHNILSQNNFIVTSMSQTILHTQTFMWGLHIVLCLPDVFGGRVTDDTVWDLSWATTEHHWSVDVVKHNYHTHHYIYNRLRPLILKGPGKYHLHMHGINERLLWYILIKCCDQMNLTSHPHKLQRPEYEAKLKHACSMTVQMLSCTH